MAGNKYVGLIDVRDDSGPPRQRTQPNTSSLLARVGRCIGGTPAVKRHIGTISVGTFNNRHRHGAYGRTNGRTDRQGVKRKRPPIVGPLIIRTSTVLDILD